MKNYKDKPINRRAFTRTALMGTAGILAMGNLAMPNIARAAKPKIIVIGGGVAGATTAKYLAKSNQDQLDITLIEPNKQYVTCFFSNLYLGGLRTFSSITHEYKTLSKQYGIRMAHMLAYGVDADQRSVRLSNGSKLDYDRLIITPGIDFHYDAYEGYDEATSWKLPHAYQAGPQTTLLKQQLMDMPDGGTFLMVAPPNPYRCPPGPYERVSMVAHYLKNHKPKSKIVVLDRKDKFSKQGLFEEGWNNFYPGMIEWLSNDMLEDISAVDATNKTVTAGGERFKGDVINLIPPQKAGKIAHLAGITDESGWCPIKNAENFASALVDNIHVLGDASINGAMPKSGFSANSQAKSVAMHIGSELLGKNAYPSRFRNTCWSLITADNAVKVGANYTADGNKTVSADPFVSKVDEAASLRETTRDEAYAWYDSITQDIFA